MTIGEVDRKVDAIDRHLVALREDMARFLERVESTYQRKDVAQAQANAADIRLLDIGARVTEIEANQTANRRLVIGALIYPLVVGVVVALMMVAIR